ncbi:hypothetical protein QE152_g6934 [Popillia japonica]|uniref:Uncharacterized protein n=1 Tax=Popillia japonica TaxID=7064 RepID=A0AAW1MGF5_POPJA
MSEVAVVLLYRGGYFTGGVYEVEEPLGAFFLTMEYMVAGTLSGPIVERQLPEYQVTGNLLHAQRKEPAAGTLLAKKMKEFTTN